VRRTTRRAGTKRFNLYLFTSMKTRDRIRQDEAGMKRGHSRIRIAIHKKSVLCLFLVVATVALPLSMAQACQTSVATETACCRAMRFACHGSGTPNACCLRNASVPAPSAMPLPVKSASIHAPVLTVLWMLHAAYPNLQNPTARQSRNPLAGHSPPGNVHIFLLHSALLI